MAVIIPEVEIFNTLKAILAYIRSDFDKRSDPTDTLLYKLLGENSLQRYNFFEQAQAVFLAKEDSSRFLDVNMFFNLERANIPTIHITLPSEQSDKDGIGIDEGYQGYDEITDPDDENQGQTLPNYTRRFGTLYNIIITSDNSNEVVLIYAVLRAILIPTFDSLNAAGLENCKLSGRDIQNMNTLVPSHIVMRTIGISLEYEVIVNGLFAQDIVKQLLLSYSVLQEPTSGKETVTDLIAITGDSACPPPVCADVVVENSDATYSKTVVSGGILDLPDIPHVDSDGKTVLKPAQTPFISTPLSNNISTKFHWKDTDDITVVFEIDSDSAGIYTSISDDGSSGDITIEVNETGGFVDFSTLDPLTLINTNKIQFKRTIFTVSGFAKLTGTF